jgi:hypothetical protein
MRRLYLGRQVFNLKRLYKIWTFDRQVMSLTVDICCTKQLVRCSLRSYFIESTEGFIESTEGKRCVKRRKQHVCNNNNGYDNPKILPKHNKSPISPKRSITYDQLINSSFWSG